MNMALQIHTQTHIDHVIKARFTAVKLASKILQHTQSRHAAAFDEMMHLLNVLVQDSPKRAITAHQNLI
jgi:hypothetical protein